jgi:hypothetical protein
MSKLAIRFALLALAVLVVVPLAHAQKNSSAVVKIAATADKADPAGVQTVTLTLDHEKDWHTYANPVGNKELDGTQTTVKFAAGKPVEVVKITYPKGTVEPDATVGNYFIYAAKTTITAQIKRTAGDASPLEASVFIQACNNKKGCLLPATVKVSVP